MINHNNYQKADDLTKDIDPDDLLFVGLALHFHCKLWSGDKRLINGLRKKEFMQIITTDELFQNYLNKEVKRRDKRK